MRPTIRTACLPLIVITLLCMSPALAQTGDQLEEFIDRTGELIDWAAELVGESENQQARRILDEARNLHLRSRQHLGNGQPRQALTMSQRARAAAHHAAKLARETQGQQERLRMRLERFGELRDQLFERVREADDERALRFLREADQQAHRAQDHYRQGNVEMALHLLNAAEELLARATRLLFEGGGGERLERELERTRALLEHSIEQLERSGARDTAADLLQSAGEALARAEDFRDRQQPLRALHSLRLARRLAAQAVTVGSARIEPEVVREQLQRWDERYEVVADLVRESDSRQALTVLERARHHRDEAGRRLAAGEVEPALRQLKAAFDLLNEASDLTR